ncbi:MAG: DinB family protein [Acidobacteria bacterium]|nr:MAG: DinB family protein [Acidobacteriota bacterium]REK11759.1 MAG: DinB family protein [Acidobacteriota bacterium]
MTRSKRLLCSLALLVAVLLVAGPAIAQDGLRAELSRDLAQIEEKIVGLADAIPADKYGWAPEEGVRTVSQSLMHTATANFFFASMLGVAAPEGLDLRGLEKVTDKAEVKKLLEQSFDHLGKAIESAEDLTAPKSYFGQDGTVAGLLHAGLSHNHEHLGQMIAYARSNGVKPPWS